MKDAEWIADLLRHGLLQASLAILSGITAAIDTRNVLRGIPDSHYRRGGT